MWYTCMSSIWGYMKSAWALVDTITGKKIMKLALTTQLLVRLSWKLACSVFVQGAIIAYEDIDITLKTRLPSINRHSAAIRQLLKEANWNETRCACLTHGPKSLRNFKEMCVNGILCNILQIVGMTWHKIINKCLWESGNSWCYSSCTAEKLCIYMEYYLNRFRKLQAY